MPDFLSKEEIRKWRSSLERITLEEYAARLGKVIQEEKHDDSLVDSVILKSLNSMTTEKYSPVTEKIHTLSLKSFNREKELKEKDEASAVKPAVPEPEKTSNVKSNTGVTVEMKAKEAQKVKAVKEELKSIKPERETNTEKLSETEKKCEQSRDVEMNVTSGYEKEIGGNADISFSFNKALTSREQLVFDHFLENKNTIVYAADLAKILDLPRDYVYKYIKNLRSKLNEDVLQNAEKGGYMLKV